MFRCLVPLAAAVGVVLLAAGCGGTTTYSLHKTQACLKKEGGVRLSGVPRSDLVASIAEGGAVVAKLQSQNQVTIAFGQNGKQANLISAGYRRFHGRNIGINDVLRPDHNAVLLWKAHPSEQDTSTVNGCLK